MIDEDGGDNTDHDDEGVLHCNHVLDEAFMMMRIMLMIMMETLTKL